MPQKNLHLLVYIAIVMGFAGLFSCNNILSSEKNELSSFTCSIDDVDFEKSKKKYLYHFSNGDPVEVTFGGGVTEEESYKGGKSVHLTQKVKYGLTVRLEDAKVNQYYKVSIWRKDKQALSGLTVQIENAPSSYVVHKAANRKGKDGWELLEYEFEVPPNAGLVSIYAYIANSKSAYFDELTIERADEKAYTKHEHPNTINLYFTEKKIQKFEAARKVAFNEGVHFSDGNWNKGILSSVGEVLPIKARFKGDWLDHLKGKKWSFRIKMRKGKTFRRLREFSVQTPESRYFLHEYLSHQLFQQEGLLTTRYDFVPVYINQKSRGIYAIEEHFTKQLIESSLRREGPILKFDENPMWRNMAIYVGPNAYGGWGNTPNYETSRILPFGASKLLATEKLKQQFLIGHSLVTQLKNRTAPVEELFEVDKLAKYLALTDLHGGTHGATWHNMRFYYNPISCKLEVINYDNFTPGYTREKDKGLLGLKLKQENEDHIFNNLFHYLFSSEEVVGKYIEYLEQYSQEQFVLDFCRNQKVKIEEYLPLIQEEFPYYSIDSSYLIGNAAKVRAQLPELKERYTNGFYDSIVYKDTKINFSDKYWAALFPHYTNAYYSKQNDNAFLRLENFNNSPIKPKKLLDVNKRPIYSFTEVTKVESHYNKANFKELELPYFANAKYLEFEELDSNQTYLTALTLWRKNTTASPYQKFIKDETANPIQLFELKNDTFYLASGNYTLSNKIFIPKDKVVAIEEGTNVDLVKEAAIISESPVYFMGTSENPVKIFSSDNSANGIAVLKAGKQSKVEHTVFSGLNTFTLNGWALSGAVNFYESPVEILHSTFEKNHCEDALNIIRTDFTVAHCNFEDIFADAFDSDFCTGKLLNSNFNRVGNDAIDFSTSQIHIEDCSIKNISDKGVSGGEGSTLWVKNTSIEACNIGAASKDLSEVYLDKVSIKNSKYGLVLLQKKPEYGPALIKAEQLDLNNCEEDFLIEKGSSVELGNKTIEGNREKVAEMFY